jgi:hypothetical protein
MSRKAGAIIYFNADKGYGFITPDGGGAASATLTTIAFDNGGLRWLEIST